MANTVRGLEQLTLKELTDEFGSLHPASTPVLAAYTSELTRRAAKATIRAANTAFWSAIIATVGVLVAAAAIVTDVLTLAG